MKTRSWMAPVLALFFFSILAVIGLSKVDELFAVEAEYHRLNHRLNITQEHNTIAKIVEDIDSNTGKIFKGHRFRTFTGDRLFRNGWEKTIQTTKSTPTEATKCNRWGVVTTIFEPSEAVRRVGNMEGWCLVIVADTKTPSEYLKNAGLDNKVSTVKYLTVEEQTSWGNNTGKVGAFVRSMPYRHFARKNIGFLYAIRNGAEYIFDFDDDNLVNLDSEGNPVELVPDLNNVSTPLLGKKVFNPYPLMQSSQPDSWPRGLPLEAVLDPRTRGNIHYYKDVPINKVGVIQYLADGNPDIDAIHRLTKNLPMTFSSNSNPLLVPTHAFVPYNAQATVHTKPAFWATLLPFTVPGRVSDIWRSYFAETLFREIGLKVVFAPPHVVQERNEHNILADMEAELDLYFKSGRLLKFLDSWKADSVDSLPGLMEQLWIDLYERGYIDENDVKVVQLWLAALIESGYTFPPLQRRHRNVAVMGQFNHAAPTERVLLWAQKWKEIFYYVVVRGAFNETEIAELRAHDIDAYSHPTESSPGFLSPMDNLGRTLTQFQGHHEVGAVLYMHDDGLLNVTTLKNGTSRLPTNEIIGTTRHYQADLSYADPRTADKSEVAKFVYKIHRNGTFENMQGEMFENEKGLISSLERWRMYGRRACMPGQQLLATNAHSDRYREPDGSILFSSFTQADMLFVPVSVANEFVNATRLFSEAGVYLECSSGTIVDMVRQKTNVKTRVLPLCTTWGGKRGKMDMVRQCQNRKQTDGFVHPIKMGYGLMQWDQSFVIVTSK